MKKIAAAHWDWLLLQQEQFRHDQRNHSDISCLSKSERLKHYGLHFAKYAGRLARGSRETFSIERTVTDTALVCLSTANTLHQHLENCDLSAANSPTYNDPLLPLADAAGRFADACEKIDHLEEFLPIAKQANEDIAKWAVAMSLERGLDLPSSMRRRRQELADRQFFVAD